MADKQSGLLVTLGKRLLGFNTSSSGCCAAPTAATQEAKKPEIPEPAAKALNVVTPDPKATTGSCCAPSCCSAETPADARRA
jgi:hypothetical protein